MHPVRRFVISLLCLVAVLSAGALGYHFLEGWTLFESLYMTVITIATVGFREVHDLSLAGQSFTMALILTGGGLIAYTMTNLVQFAVEGQLRDYLGRSKVTKGIAGLTNHYIVCGYGRIGQLLCRELAARPVPFVVIEKDPGMSNDLTTSDFLFLQGDATRDEMLLEAGIERARGLITVTASDTDNLFITLSARGMRPDLFILSRCADPSSELKLKRAGATQVVSPYVIGAHRIAQAILRPRVMDFLEVAMARQSLEVQIEEVDIAPDSALVGKDLRASGIRNLGLILIGVRKADGAMRFNPGPDTRLDAGDVLITLGEPPANQQLTAIAAGLAPA